MVKKDTICNVKTIVTSRQAFSKVLYAIESTVQFFESGKGGCPHPHNEVIIEEAIVFWILFIQFIDRLRPGWRLCGPCGKKSLTCLTEIIYTLQFSLE